MTNLTIGSSVPHVFPGTLLTENNLVYIVVMETVQPRSIQLSIPAGVPLRPTFTKSVVGGALPYLLLGGLVLLGTIGYRGWQTYSLFQEQQTWETGTEAGQAITRGQKFTRYSFFYEYDFEVIYNDTDKNVYHRPMLFSSLKNPLDETIQPEVRYNPDNPTEFAVSWGVEQFTPRLWAILAYGAFWSLVGGILVAMGFGRLSLYSDAVRCAASPSIGLFPVIETLPPKEEGDITYRYRFLQKEKFVDGEVSAPAGNEGPFLVRNANTQQLFLLTLLDPKNTGRHVLLRQDLYPLSLSSEEISRIQNEAKLIS